jgi:predicted TPR repeat methyltransferase
VSEMQLFSTLTFPEIDERVLVGPLFRPFAQEVIARLEPTRSDSLIDIACGTGIVARLAREALGSGPRLVGVDIAPRCSRWHAASIRVSTGEKAPSCRCL